MGAHYMGARSFEAKDAQTAMDIANEIIEDSLYTDGHSAYSGGLGTCRGAEILEERMSLEEADKYIGEYHNKWEPMMVIQDSKNEQLWHYGGRCAS